MATVNTEPRRGEALWEGPRICTGSLRACLIRPGCRRSIGRTRFRSPDWGRGRAGWGTWSPSSCRARRCDTCRCTWARSPSRDPWARARTGRAAPWSGSWARCWTCDCAPGWMHRSGSDCTCAWGRPRLSSPIVTHPPDSAPALLYPSFGLPL